MKFFRPSTALFAFVMLAQSNITTGQEVLWTKDRLIFETLAFAPNEKLIAGGTSSGRVELWDIQAKSNRTVFEDRDNTISHLAFSSDSRRLALACADTSLTVLDLEGPLTRRKVEGDNRALQTIVFDPNDSNTLYGGGKGGNLIQWNLATQKSIVLAKIGKPIQSIVITKRRDSLIFVADDEADNVFEKRLPGAYFRFDFAKKKAERIKLESKGQLTAACTLSETFVAFGTFSGQLLVVDVLSNKIHKTKAGTDVITAISSSQNGDILAVAHIFGKVLVWDRKADRIVAEFERPGQLTFDAAMSPSGKMFAGTFGNEELTEGIVILQRVAPQK